MDCHNCSFAAIRAVRLLSSNNPSCAIVDLGLWTLDFGPFLRLYDRDFEVHAVKLVTEMAAPKETVLVSEPD